MGVAQPSVCAVMLTRDRPEMARRAVECFRDQTYSHARLGIIDTSSGDFDPVLCGWHFESDYKSYVHMPELRGKTIGELRNFIVHSTPKDSILIHWDDDDWSHPNRIAEQVALLQASGADVVGYREMLFLDQRVAVYNNAPTIDEDKWTRSEGAAYLYTNDNPYYALGTSLCYWRKTWERKPFEPTSQGEDHSFMVGLKCVGVSAMDNLGAVKLTDNPPADCFEPRMVARIHTGNTSNSYTPDHMRREEWRRAPAWDQHCRSVFA